MIVKNPILARKLKNAIVKANPTGEYEFDIKNISVNGQKRGCSGFIRSLTNGSVVYVTTEELVYSPLKYMYRYADNMKDYTGYHNRWATTLDELAGNIGELLKSTPTEANDRRI